MLACILNAFIPESPKYYLSQSKYSAARGTLVKIYQKKNTKTSAETFKVSMVMRPIQIIFGYFP